MFWRVDEELRTAADNLMKECNGYMERARERKVPDEDLLLLQEAIQHA
jgi:hypothetical protein